MSVQKSTRRDPDLTFWERLMKASEWAAVPCSPSDIAQELGITPGAVTKYVNGGFPKIDNINVLATRRKVRSEWLLSGSGEMVSEGALEEDAQELLRLYRALPPDAKERLMSSAQYEVNAATQALIGKQAVLTEELIKLLEKQKSQ